MPASSHNDSGAWCGGSDYGQARCKGCMKGMSMRIWILTSELPQEFAGGIARYMENFARLLGEAGHEVVVIARTEQACDKPLAPGVRLIGISPGYTRLNEPNPGG